MNYFHRRWIELSTIIFSGILYVYTIFCFSQLAARSLPSLFRGIAGLFGSRSSRSRSIKAFPGQRDEIRQMVVKVSGLGVFFEFQRIFAHFPIFDCCEAQVL